MDYPSYNDYDDDVIIIIIIIMINLIILRSQWTGAGSVRCACGVALSACEFPSIRSKPHQKFDDTLIFYKRWIGIITFLDLLQMTYKKGLNSCVSLLSDTK